MADRSEEFRRITEICQSETATSFSSSSVGNQPQADNPFHPSKQNHLNTKEPSPFTVQCNATYSLVRDNDENVKKMERL